jgi:hypothetical protein
VSSSSASASATGVGFFGSSVPQPVARLAITAINHALVQVRNVIKGPRGAGERVVRMER